MSLQQIISPSAPSAPESLSQTYNPSNQTTTGIQNGTEAIKLPPPFPTTVAPIAVMLPEPAAPPGKLRSWRKKYRKLKVRFDVAMSDSNKLFKEEKSHLVRCRRIQEEIEYVILLDSGKY
jgi:hypothetical protein